MEKYWENSNNLQVAPIWIILLLNFLTAPENNLISEQTYLIFTCYYLRAMSLSRTESFKSSSSEVRMSFFFIKVFILLSLAWEIII